MASFRPLSRRDDPTFHVLVDGVPRHLAEPLVQWFRWVLDTNGALDLAKIQALQNKLRLATPLRWDGSVYTWADFRARVRSNGGNFGLDAADAVLQMGYVTENLRGYLDMLLRDSGSKWQVALLVGERAQLTERAPGPVAAALLEVASASDRAHRHLRDSWVALMGRSPSPSTAYREAVRAVEAAAKPVVSPNNPQTTLGTAIRDLEAKPEKWALILDHASVEQVIGLCKLVWRGQTDRHGSDDPDAPLAVSQEEADAAFFAALTLARWFTSGAIHRCEVQ